MSDRFEAERCPAEVVFSTLVDQERRAVLRELSGNGVSQSVPALAGTIQNARTGYRGRHVHLRLHHQHLPMMAEGGLVNYDSAGQRVTLTPTGQQAAEIERHTADLLDD